jgi:hypothetical protein
MENFKLKPGDLVMFTRDILFIRDGYTPESPFGVGMVLKKSDRQSILGEEMWVVYFSGPNNGIIHCKNNNLQVI